MNTHEPNSSHLRFEALPPEIIKASFCCPKTRRLVQQYKSMEIDMLTLFQNLSLDYLKRLRKIDPIFQL